MAKYDLVKDKTWSGQRPTLALHWSETNPSSALVKRPIPIWSEISSIAMLWLETKIAMLWSDTNLPTLTERSARPLYFSATSDFRKHLRKYFRKHFRKHFRHPESVPHYSVPTTLDKNAFWWLPTSGSTSGSTSGTPKASLTSNNSMSQIYKQQSLSIILKLYSESTGAIEFIANS